MQADSAKLEDLRKLASTLSQQQVKIDALFVNAGIAPPNAFESTTADAFDTVFDTNVKGVFFTVQTLLPLVKDGAAIVLTGSIVGNKGLPNLSLYNASKAAVRSLARSLASDLSPRRIRVNCLSPGLTETPIFKTGLKMDDAQIEQLKLSARSTVPLGHVAQPGQIATAALFLGSSAASYVNGVELSVDGGMAQV